MQTVAELALLWQGRQRAQSHAYRAVQRTSCDATPVTAFHCLSKNEEILINFRKMTQPSTIFLEIIKDFTVFAEVLMGCCSGERTGATAG